MRRFIFSFICLGLFLLGSYRHLEALELEFTGGLNNLTFHPDRVTGHSVSRNYKEFQGYPYILGDFTVKSNSFDKYGFKIHGSRDNILRNTLFTLVTTNWDIISLEFGPYIGAEDSYDSLKKPELGVKGSFEVAFPGIIFFSLDGSSTLGANFDFFSDNLRETAEFKIGFWVPYIIPSLSASIKSYSRKSDESTEIRDELIRLALSADIFNKNFPLLLRVDAGYEILSRTYYRDYRDSFVKDELSVFFAGVEAKLQVQKMIKVILGFEIPVYCMPVEPMEKELPFDLFRAHAGISINLY